MDNLDKYIKGDNEFKDILEIIRNHLCNDEGSFNIEYGAIAFYNFNPKLKKTEVKVFPLNENIIEKHFPKDQKIRKKYLEKINQERNYKEFYYYTEFKEKYDTTEHFGFTLRRKKDILEHSDTEIEGESWSQFLKGKTKYNILDQLFFETNNSEFQIIPLPVLYSPATLLVLQKGSVSSDKIDSVVNKIGESIHFYLFNKLLTEITNDLKPGVIKDHQELIEKFLVEIAQVAIPVKYQIGDNKAEDCFGWFGKDEGKIKTVPLKLADEKVQLFMPDFCWHCGDIISKKTEFQIKEREVVKTIENIFGLVFEYWQTINSKKLLLKEQVTPLITKLKQNLDNSENLKDELNSKIENQSRQIDKLSQLLIDLGGDATQPFENEFYFDTKSDGTKQWYLRFNGVPIAVAKENKGYEELQTIIYNKNQEIDVSTFGAKNNIIDKSFKNDPIVSSQKLKYKAEIDRLDNIIVNRQASIDDYKDCLYNLAGYINTCKYLGLSCTTENHKKNNYLVIVKGYLNDSEFREFQNVIENVGKQDKIQTLDKQEKDAILNPIRHLIKALKKKENGILEPLLDCIKVGVKSKFTPTKDVDVLWRFEKPSSSTK